MGKKIVIVGSASEKNFLRSFYYKGDSKKMRLREWQDANGKKVSTTSGTSSTASSGSFKKRLDKLITYYGQHLPARVDYLTVDLLTNDKLEFTEHWNTGDKVEFKIYIGPATEAWRLKVSKNSKYTDDLNGMGWVSLLRELRSYMTIPVVSTPEYKSLLTEWVDSKGKKISHSTSASSTSTSSKTNKEKFTSLLYYMKKNKGSLVDKAAVVRLDDGGFTYKEHYKLTATASEYTLTLLVGYSRFNSSWRYELYMDTSLIKELQGNGWEELLEELEKYFHVPKAGSLEYKKLCESCSIAEDFKLYENLWD